MDDVALIVQLRVVLRVNKEKRTTFFSNVSNFLWVKCVLVLNILRQQIWMSVREQVWIHSVLGDLEKRNPPQGSPSYSF